MYRSFVAAQSAADSYPFTATVVDARHGARTITFTGPDEYTEVKTTVLVLTDHNDEVYAIDTRENIVATLWELTSIDPELIDAVEQGRWDQTTYRLLAEAQIGLRIATTEECFQ